MVKQNSKILRYKTELIEDLKRLSEIRETITELAKKNGFSEKTISHIRVILDEAITNGMFHGYRGLDIEKKVEINCSCSGQYFELRVRDHGIGFDISEWKEPDFTNEDIRTAFSGRGIILIRTFSDSSDFIKLNTGTEVIMRINNKKNHE